LMGGDITLLSVSRSSLTSACVGSRMAEQGGASGDNADMLGVVDWQPVAIVIVVEAFEMQEADIGIGPLKAVAAEVEALTQCSDLGIKALACTTEVTKTLRGHMVLSKVS
jgi:hypothetical protein